MPSGFRFPDPNVATRQAYTDAMLNAEVPTDANEQWASKVNYLKRLYRLLIDHPAMAENKFQTFMTPAAYKNKVYFIWDFVGRTLGMLLMLDPKRPQEDNLGHWSDASGRVEFAKLLIMDKGPDSKLDLMCPDDRGQKVEFGDEIEGLVGELDANVVGDGLASAH
ncbi:hypothetical protein P152DRAFT_5453 [Eremomyces bilateralis CBS 781.70]|uniref:Uncharacterized protein n=1 Tax=Eremomyces bilateralis CBS 781.70 TaxID=1392243 RepID=A0A6G1GGE8_9PEZI|nr:uncharacterized protein P152DRAFT_5453 [Eremomyces bilateralis CBS 781.70]KAF1816981.1 hypothetical protein P152DRAFT_5453 [Eremomyces bilateralis CBS 781.70]